MKPWREVAKPHADVLAGTFVQSDFAVDIMKVVDGSAPDEYRNPEAFYERTYVTEGMKQLLVTVAQRLNGRGGDPVIELKTNFGGGKSPPVRISAFRSFEGKRRGGPLGILEHSGPSEGGSAGVIWREAIRSAVILKIAVE